MKIGVKTWRSEKFLKHFEKTADFFEVQAIQSENYKFLKKFSKPIVIHAEHSGFGVNPADKTLKKKNLKSINYAIKIADSIDAKKIILHPGFIKNKNCSEQNSIEFIKDLKDKRILIENVVPHNNGLCLTPKQTKNFLKQTNKKFIFDLAHSILTSNYLKKDYEKTIKEFLKLKPKHFHISGQKLKSKKDNHNPLKKSDLDFKKILKLYPKNAEITLETNPSIKNTEEDIEFIRKIIQ